ncbi:MAG: ATP-binding protein, partial [Clostridiales bacterium]
MKKTNWYVITGAPSSGKTKLIEHLSFLNYNTIPEAARIYIDQKLSEGNTIKNLREDEGKFQKKVLQMKIDVEKKVNPDVLTFFDRGILDSIAYYSILGLDLKSVISANKMIYKGIFFLESLDTYDITDTARVENLKTAEKLEKLLEQSYTDYGYKV